MAMATVFLVGVVAFIAYKQTRYWLRWRALRRWGQSQGCREPATVPNYLYGGIERYINFFLTLADTDILETYLVARYDSVGAYTFRFFNPFNSSMLQTAEPANVQAMLATQFQDFNLGPARHRAFHAMFGDGIFTADGDTWAHFRHQLRPQFARDQIADLASAEKHLNVLFKALPEENEKGWIEQTDLMPFFYRFTLDVSTEFLFGRSVDSQSRALHSVDSGNETDVQEDMDFATALEYGQSYMGWRYRLGTLYWLLNSKKFQDSCHIVQSFVGRFVTEALERSGSQKDLKKFVLLDELVKETRDPVELRDQVLHLILAGRDTTSALLSWVILLLSHSPEEFSQLRSTVIDHFGTSQSPKQTLTFESLKACRRLSWVLFETLRLYPLISVNDRTALKDTTLPVGGGPDGKSPIVVKKGERVGYAAYVLQRRKDLWGDDAKEWKPERWNGRKLGWEFITFSGGPRICLGQQYALTEASFVLVRFLQRHDAVETLDVKGVIKKGLSLTLKPAEGVKVRMHRATE